MLGLLRIVSNMYKYMYIGGIGYGRGLEPGLGLFRYTSSTLLEPLNLKLHKYRRIFFSEIELLLI